MESFERAIRDRVLVCDGAMGTMLYARGAFLNRPFDELNITRPELVLGVHRDYVDAGADVIESNTFGANRQRLESFDLADQVEAFNAAGVELARRAAGPSTYVAGAIGPLGEAGPPREGAARHDAVSCFAEQASALATAGVDLFVLETFRSLDELVDAVTGVRAVSRLPIVAELTTLATGEFLGGVHARDVVSRLVDAGASVPGVNCGFGPAAMLETIERLHRVSEVPLAAQPNAGRPREVEGRMMYLSSPDYLASYARRFIQCGVRLVGGCCGTTPAHIRQMAAVVREVTPSLEEVIRPGRDVGSTAD